jgi:ABC-2 type transport system permease protein
MSATRIARHELRLAWRTRVVAVLGILLALIVAGAAAAGDARVRRDANQGARFQALVDRQWKEQPDRHPHRVSHYGFLLFRPRAPLSSFDSGVESFSGSALFLEAHRQNSANFADAALDGAGRRFGELTMASVLQLFVPLLLFAVAGVAISREREGGTLWLLLCQGTSWRALLWGKLLGVWLAVAGLVGPGLVLTAVWLTSRGGGALWTRDHVSRVALLVAAHACYFAVCAALALLVSASHRTSRAAMATLMAVWIALWVVFPRALPWLAASRYPLPARALLEARVDARVRELGDSHNPTDPKFQALRESYLRKYGAARLEDLPINYNGVVMFESEKATSDAYREEWSALVDTLRRQARLVGWAGLLSPYVAMRNLSMALSGVDVAHGIDFERQAEEYRYRLIQDLNELHTREVSYARDRYEGVGIGGAPTRQRISHDHFDSLPLFEYARPGVSWSLRETPAGMVTLGWWIAGLLVAVAVAARRAPSM